MSRIAKQPAGERCLPGFFVPTAPAAFRPPLRPLLYDSRLLRYP